MSPFHKPQYTQIPNDLFDRWLPELTLVELKVLMAVLRDTLGFQRNQTRLSITDLEKATGLSRQGVLDGASALESKNLVKKVQDGGKTLWSVEWHKDPPHMGDKVVNSFDQNKRSGQTSRPVKGAGSQRSRLPSIKEKRLKKEEEEDSVLKEKSSKNTDLNKNDLSTIWERVLRTVNSSRGLKGDEKLFSDRIRLINLEGEVAVVEVTEADYRDWLIRNHYDRYISISLQNVVGETAIKTDFVLSQAVEVT